MNTEKQLQESNKLLKELMLRLSAEDPEENKQKQEEIDELNKSIDEYETEINKLKEKLEDENNYTRGPSGFEGKNTNVLEEMTTESVEKERISIRSLLQEYRKGQEVETKKIREYNSKAEQLKIEIDNIKQRLIKDELAKESGIAKNIHLTAEEIEKLKEEISYRESLIEEANRIIDLSADEIRRYGLLITENSEHLERLKVREQKVASFGKDRIMYPNSLIDTYALRNDKDNLAKLESGLKALKNRVKVLMYNPSEEIKKQIEENERALNLLVKEEFDNNEEVVKETKEEVEATKVFDFASENKQEEIFKDSVIPKELDDTINKLFENQNIEDENVQPDPSMEKNIESSSDENLNKFIEQVFERTKPLVKEEKEEVEHELEQPDEKTRDELRSESEVFELKEIEDAPENLKKEKLTTRFIKAWQNWRKKLSAASIELAYDVADKIKSKTEEQIPEVEKGEFSFTDENLGVKKLTNLGEYTFVDLSNGEEVYIKYGDKQEDVPEDITIKYEGDEMIISYPKVKGRRR